MVSVQLQKQLLDVFMHVAHVRRCGQDPSPFLYYCAIETVFVLYLCHSVLAAFGVQGVKPKIDLVGCRLDQTEGIRLSYGERQG